MKTEFRSDCLHLVRALAVFFFAAVAAGAVFYAVLLEIRQHRNIDEGGIVESTQLAVLALSALVFAVQARLDRETPRAFAMVSLATLAMFVREMDGYFDAWSGDHACWLYVDAAVLLAFVSIPLRRFGRTVGELSRFSATPQCLLFVTGVVFSVVVAQLIGYKEIWNRIFDVEIWRDAKAAHLLDTGHLPVELNITRHVKNTVEESIELGSYLMILGAAALPPLLRRKSAG